MKDDLNVLAQDAKDTARASLVEVKNSAGRVVDAVKQRGVQVVDAAGGTVSDHPLKSLGIAFGVGVLVGALMFRPKN